MGNSNNKESLFEAVNSDDCPKVEVLLKVKYEYRFSISRQILHG